jgi:hypothetical protein
MAGAFTISITIWNHTSVTLTTYNATATAGTYPTPVGMNPPASGGTLAINLPPGGSLTVFVSNAGVGGSSGTINLSDAEESTFFSIQYAPLPNKSLVIQSMDLRVVPSSAFPSCVGFSDEKFYLGTAMAANISLYAGVPVPEWNSSGHEYVAGYAAPLAANPYSANNARDVVNSLFQTDIRKPDGVQHWFNQGSTVPYRPADYTGNQLMPSSTSQSLVQVMLDLWPTGLNPSYTSNPDWPLIFFLANFMVPPGSTPLPPLVMYVPTITYQNTIAAGPRYLLTGYQAYPLAGTNGARFNMASVQTFLQLFLGGAHFVNIQTNPDFATLNPENPPANTGRSLYGAFTKHFPASPTGGRQSCIGNSHYTSTVNLGGWYYGSQIGNWASAGCGLLLAALFGQTANGPYNTFLQLEGWPADVSLKTGSLGGGERHAQDYAAYKNSLWNISTFGATPYSEKRATTIFLAPLPWVPKICSSTYMMPYVGAQTPQGWLQTDLVSVPPGTPSQPYP